MSDRLLVATRKGLFTIGRNGGKWSIMQTSFLGEPVTAVLPDRRDGSTYVALNLGHFGVKFHRTRDGEKWEECQTPSYPRIEATGDEQKGDSLNQIWVLEAGGPDQPDLLWAGTIPGGLFRSRDRGASWELITSLWDRPERREWFGGGYDKPGIHSVCVNPRDGRQITVGVSCGGVWFSNDGGESWQVRAKGMYAAFMPPDRREDPIIQDPHRLAQCAAAPEVIWAQHHNGMFRTTDGGLNWQEIKDVQPSTFGFACAAHPTNTDTAWFVPAVKDECRLPANAQLVVTRTRDGGKSFEILRAGLPQEHAYDLVYRHGLDVDDSGERLAMGSTTGGLWLSEDQGDNWHCLSAHLPPVYCVRFV